MCVCFRLSLSKISHELLNRLSKLSTIHYLLALTQLKIDATLIHIRKINIKQSSMSIMQLDVVSGLLDGQLFVESFCLSSERLLQPLL